MRRSRLLPFLLGLCLAGPVVPAGELEEAVAGNLAARGGEPNLRALRSVRMTGKMVLEGAGLEGPLVFLWKAPNKLRMEFTFQGQTGVQAYDGQSGWTLMPFQGQTAPEPTGDEELRLLAEQADFQGPFLDTAKKGYALAYLGREDVRGKPADKIKVTNPYGQDTIVYLDAERHLEVKSETTRKVFETEIEIETSQTDYRAVGGLMFPHAVEGKPKGAAAGQSLIFDKIEVNVDVDDALFAMPAAQPKPVPAAAD